MRVVDFRDDSAPTHARVVVIGSGPAGMTVAAELASAGHDVLIIESGPDADALSAVENVGSTRVEPQHLVRRREPGGSSAVWSGRCTPLDAIDFRSRPWVAYSGWPIGQAELDPFTERASTILGLAEQRYDDGVWPLLGIEPRIPNLDSAVVERFWQFSRGRLDPHAATRFATDLPSDAQLLKGATVTRILQEKGTVHGVEIASLTGKRALIDVDYLVVAAGAIETPRLLLHSGLGNDLVGRFLMDHPGVPLASVEGPGAAAIRDRFGLYWRTANPARLAYVNGVALSPEIQESEALLNAACWLDEYPSAEDPWQAGIRILRQIRRSDDAGVNSAAVEFWRSTGSQPDRSSLLRDAWRVLRHPRLLWAGLKRLRRGRPPLYLVDRVDLYALVEQLPDPESRITLSEIADPLGMPIARIDWRLHDEEYATARRLLDLVIEEFTQAGWEPPVAAPWMGDAASWRAHTLDRAHQLGTVRMSHDPDGGAVDADCRLFGTTNLWIAGGSVFPTSGHANPTLTIVLLALRLAEKLSSILSTADPAESSR